MHLLRQIMGVPSGPLFGVWDIGLVLTVALFATILAYLHDPKWKAFMISLPGPFTMAFLSLGRPVDATNAVGLLVLLIYTHGVRVLHYGLKLSIMASILLSVSVFIGLGRVLAMVLPPGAGAFWSSSIALLILAVLHLIYYPNVEEPGHRTPMPLWEKLPLVLLITVGLVILKKSLQGFMTVFPMIGVFSSYESRKSLSTVCRQLAVLMICLLIMQMTMRVAQVHFGLGPGWTLLIGWLAFLIVLWPVNRYAWTRTAIPAEARESEVVASRQS